MHEPIHATNMIARHSKRATAEALFSTSQTLRNLANRATGEAIAAEGENNYRRLVEWRAEAREYWRRAWFYFYWACQEFQQGA